MTRVSRRAPTDRAAIDAAVEALAGVGLREGSRVRFHRSEGGRWLEGRAVALEPDGSLGLVDARGRR